MNTNQCRNKTVDLNEMAQDFQVVIFHVPVTIFDDKELREFSGVKKTEPHYIEIVCGCTVRKHGDTLGNLKIFDDGKLDIICQCSEQCKQVSLSPAEFAKHVRKPSPATKWSNHIWVFNSESERVKLSKTCLLKYHTHVQPLYQSLLDEPTVHRDEFVRCIKCRKERRFSQRTIAECRAYHDAHANAEWSCSDIEIPCNDKEERQTRKNMRGCPLEPKCLGCERCICFGCSMCRFQDCSCQTCVEFCQNQTSLGL